jgi:hypothetical protein
LYRYIEAVAAGFGRGGQRVPGDARKSAPGEPADERGGDGADATWRVGGLGQACEVDSGGAGWERRREGSSVVEVMISTSTTAAGVIHRLDLARKGTDSVVVSILLPNYFEIITLFFHFHFFPFVLCLGRFSPLAHSTTTTTTARSLLFTHAANSLFGWYLPPAPLEPCCTTYKASAGDRVGFFSLFFRRCFFLAFAATPDYQSLHFPHDRKTTRRCRGDRAQQQYSRNKQQRSASRRPAKIPCV